MSCIIDPLKKEKKKRWGEREVGGEWREKTER